MPLFDFFKRKPAPHTGSPQEDAAVVQRARQQARRRLIGAVVLLGIGVIGFPLLFETQPRPIPVDIPIEIPAKEGAAPLRMPSPRARVAGPVVSEPVAAQEVAASAAASAPAAKAQAVAEARPQAPAASAPAPKPQPKPEPKTEAKPEPKAEPKPEPKAEPPKAPSAPVAAPAASAAAAQRFVVQVGAFADAAAARAVRLRVEKLGLKTFTQVVETPAGKRIRVRVGPFSAKAEADKAAQTVRKGDLPAAVLVL